MYQPEGDHTPAQVPRDMLTLCGTVTEDMVNGTLTSAGPSQPKFLSGVYGLTTPKWVSVCISCAQQRASSVTELTGYDPTYPWFLTLEQ